MRASQAFGLALMICTAACGSDSGSPAVNDDMPDAVLDASTQDAAGDAATDSAVEDSGPRPPELCSGCADESRDTSDLTIHLHHVHMNVTDRARSTAFYRDFFGAELALLNERTEALMAGPILLLLEEAEEPPSSALPTALQHVGWGSADPIAWFEDAHARGIQPDTRGHLIFATNETPTPSGTGEDFKTLLGIDFPACFTVNDEIAYVYVLGPDDERIELWPRAMSRPSRTCSATSRFRSPIWTRGASASTRSASRSSPSPRTHTASTAFSCAAQTNC